MNWRPRFKLRTLLIATAILGVFFGWLTNTLVRINHQRRIVAQMQALGCKIYYDWEAEKGKPASDRSPNGWRPLRWVLGDDAFSAVAVVNGYSANMIDRDLGPLLELPELKDVAVHGKGITDKGIAKLADIRKLRGLVLDDTSVTAEGLGCFAKCPQLVSLTLCGASVKDSMLVGLEKLQSLEYLQFVRTGVNSDGLKRVAGLSRLKELDVIDARGVTDDGLSALTSLQNLVRLRLLNTNIKDDGLQQLCGLKSLRSLTIWDDGSTGGSQISSDALKFIGELKQLQFLELIGISVNDEVANVISTLAKLQTLKLSSSKITDAGMSNLAKTTALHWLEIDSPSITDAGLLSLRPLASLEYLRIGPNISEAAAIEFRKSLPNCAIEGWDQSGALSFQLPEQNNPAPF